jgi:flagellar basal-body rod protein FlgC
MINLLNGIESTAAALTAERIRMDVVAQNIANANLMRGPDGKPYQRQQVIFESVLRDRLGGGIAGTGLPSRVQVARIETDQRPPRVVYDPQRGAIELPNINVHEEMVDMIASTRAFEANLSALKTARSMALQTLSIGKR